MINGITATQEMKCLKENNLRLQAQALQKKTSVVWNYGPIRVHDGRLRTARDEYHRQAAQADEAQWIRKKQSINEVKYIHRWMRAVRSLLRASLNTVKGVEVRGGSWMKKACQKLLSSNDDMSKRYSVIRELHEKLEVTLEGKATISWPPSYDKGTVASAVEFLRLEEQKRRTARNMMSLEADGLEIIAEDCIEVSQGEFIVPKVEED
jgi:hypothetical protein